MALAKPQVTSHPSPNHGYNGAQYVPQAVVWHITQGASQSSIDWLCSPNSNASANYVIRENGEIVELVDPDGGAGGAAWANGDVQKPDLSNALIAGWIAAKVNPNLRVVSIEHAGFTSNNHGGSLTTAQVAATIALTAWLCQHFGIAPDQDHILGHYQLNDVDRHYCPGFAATEWTQWVGQIAALVRGGPAGSDGGIRVYLNAQGQTIVEINFGGTAAAIEGVAIVDAGVTVRNARGERYARSVRAMTLLPWHSA